MTSTPRRKNVTFWIIAGAALVLFAFSGKIAGLLTDYLWFKEVQLTQVFMTTLSAKLLLGIGAGVISFIVIFGNILIAERMSRYSQKFSGKVSIQLAQTLSRITNLNVLLFIAAAAVSFFIGGWAAGFGEIYLKFRHAVPFGAVDPLFHKDIGFYVFKLPFWRFVYQLGATTVFFAFCSSLLMYLLRLTCVFDGRRIHIDAKGKAHLLALIGIMVASLYFVFQFQIYDMITAQGPLVNGAGYARIKVDLPILSAMRFVAILAAVLVWVATVRRTILLLGGAFVVLALGVVLRMAATGTVQKFVVAPQELAKEAPYIGWSIANTRAAYGLDRIESQHFVPTADLNSAAVQNNSPTIENIRLWDQEPLLTTFSQLQEIRTYYRFLDVDNDRYTINGRYRQVMLSPRELVPEDLPSRIWINEHLTYTHGYGLCLGPVTSVTPEGLPEFYIKDIPPASSIPLAVTRPQIYYGEADAGYAIVNTGALEFDYPSGEENVYTVYNGKGGIGLGGPWRKMLFSIRFQESKILLRSDITAKSRILFYRQILDRVRKAAPFLNYERDPYMVIAGDGRLKWMIDGYTATDAYPYSVAAGRMGNYIRNSVKVVIDAYDGTIDFYIADPADPIIKTWAKVFPGVFKPLSAMPTDLRSHIRYPQKLFSIQAAVYSVYHMNDPQVFYNKEDIWKIPNSYAEEESGPMSPYYTIMKLAGVGVKEEFILMVPFSPAKKENMIAWLAARCDEPNYGKLLVFDFPKQKLVYGPSQIEARINQDPEISKQLALWNQGGSRVIRGSLLVVPVDQSLLYVQPLYLVSKTGSQTGGVPELKRVVVAYENSIAMEETLGKSVATIFGGESALTEEAPAAPAAKSAAEQKLPAEFRVIVEQADREFTAGQEALKRGEWAAYGEAMNRVKQLLGELKRKVK